MKASSVQTGDVEFWVSLENIMTGCDLVVSKYRIHVLPGTEEFTRYAIPSMSTIFVVRIQPHPIFNRGGGYCSPMHTTTSDLWVKIYTPLESLQQGTAKGSIMTCGTKQKLLWSIPGPIHSSLVFLCIRNGGLPLRSVPGAAAAPHAVVPTSEDDGHDSGGPPIIMVGSPAGSKTHGYLWIVLIGDTRDDSEDSLLA